MCPIVLHDDVRIPPVADLDAFRHWAKSDDFPERGRYSFLNGDLWVDLMPEQLFTHNAVKMEYSAVILGLLKQTCRGRFFGDGTLFTNVEAGLSTEPDGLVVLFESLAGGRVELIEGTAEGFIEIAGTPDLVLEIVSATSVRKDTVVLRDLYWRAHVPEYWLVDARGPRLSFNILSHSAGGYVPTGPQAGWIRSEVLDQAFRLTSEPDQAGHPEFTLAVK